MIKFENTEVMGWKAAIRGMRNPMNSYDKMDSIFSKYSLDYDGNCWVDNNMNELPPCSCAGFEELRQDNGTGLLYAIGPNDYDLMKRLRNAGTDHRKFMRMITVYVDITAPLYWWKEFDTYKVGTVANSCSTMHKIHAKEFTLGDFSCEHLQGPGIVNLEQTIKLLNYYRECFNETITDGRRDGLDGKQIKKDWWWQMIQLLPSSYNQKRTVLLNYEVLANMYKSRKNHKLDEWREFCSWIETLPYHELITGKFEKEAIND